MCHYYWRTLGRLYRCHLKFKRHSKTPHNNLSGTAIVLLQFLSDTVDLCWLNFYVSADEMFQCGIEVLGGVSRNHKRGSTPPSTPARGSGELCEIPSGSGRSPVAKRYLVHFGPKNASAKSNFNIFTKIHQKLTSLLVKTPKKFLIPKRGQAQGHLKYATGSSALQS